MVSRAVAVDLHHAEVSGRVELDVTEEFAGAGDDKRLVGQGWHRLAEGDIARLGVEIRRVRFDIRFIQTQRQVAAVAFVPAFSQASEVALIMPWTNQASIMVCIVLSFLLIRCGVDPSP